MFVYFNKVNSISGDAVLVSRDSRLGGGVEGGWGRFSSLVKVAMFPYFVIKSNEIDNNPCGCTAAFSPSPQLQAATEQSPDLFFFFLLGDAVVCRLTKHFIFACFSPCRL